MQKTFDRMMVFVVIAVMTALGVESFTHFGEDSMLNAMRVALLLVGFALIITGLAGIMKRRQANVVSFSKKHVIFTFGVAAVTFASSL